MNTLKPQTFNLSAMLKWLARGLSVASVLTLLLFFIGEGFNPATLQSREWALMICFPISVIAGMIVAWWREGLGGVVTIAALAAFYLAHWLISGRLPGGWAFAAFSSPGIIFLGYWLLAVHERRKPYAE